MSIIGITALTEDEQEEFLFLQSLENTLESTHYSANNWWRLGELYSKSNFPASAKTNFIKAINIHLVTLSGNLRDIESWSILARCFKDGIGAASDPENALICLHNIEAIKRGDQELNTKPLEKFNKEMSDILHKAAQVLSYYDLQSRRDALNKFTQSDEAPVEHKINNVPRPF